MRVARGRKGARGGGRGWQAGEGREAVEEGQMNSRKHWSKRGRGRQKKGYTLAGREAQGESARKKST